jgi:hypothetical protein
MLLVEIKIRNEGEGRKAISKKQKAISSKQ